MHFLRLRNIFNKNKRGLFIYKMEKIKDSLLIKTKWDHWEQLWVINTYSWQKLKK